MFCLHWASRLVRNICRQSVLISLLLASPLVLAGEIFEFNGHTYKIISEPANWEDASSAAAEMYLGDKQGYLARIDSARENAAILEAVMANLTDAQLAASLAQDGSETPFIWLGGSDKDSEGQWVWSDNGDQFWQGDFNGSAVGGLFTNWGVQPDSATGEEDALAMGLSDWPEPFYDLGSAGQWNDLDITTALGYVVEFSGVSDLQLAIEEPSAGGIHSGIGAVRGWAVSSDTIQQIELFVDNEYRFDIPHGGYRPDVGDIFEEIETANQSGYAATVNYSGLDKGEHTVTVKVTDSFGSVVERSANFEVARFDSPFIFEDELVELGWSNVYALGKSLTLRGAIIGGDQYTVTLEWKTATQAFEIVRIEKLIPPPPSE